MFCAISDVLKRTSASSLSKIELASGKRASQRGIFNRTLETKCDESTYSML